MSSTIKGLIVSAEQAVEGHDPTAAAAYRLLRYLFEHGKLTDLSASRRGPLATKPEDAWHASWLAQDYPNIWSQVTAALRDYVCFRLILADLDGSRVTSTTHDFIKSVRNYKKRDVEAAWSTSGEGADSMRYYIVVYVFEYAYTNGIREITDGVEHELDKLIELHRE
ncbi:hypothetical protein JCM3765_004487, partial [Sporobolomyces pararoseus]